MKNLILLLFCLFANSFFAQTKFDNEKLTLIQDIYHNSTKKSINSFMEQKGFKSGDMEKGDDKYGDSYTFTSQFNMAYVEYTPQGQMYSVTIMYSGAINNAFIEIKLKDAGYTSKDHEQETDDGKKFIKKHWTKKGDNLSFVTTADEEEKLGILGYGTFED